MWLCGVAKQPLWLKQGNCKMRNNYCGDPHRKLEFFHCRKKLYHFRLVVTPMATCSCHGCTKLWGISNITFMEQENILKKINLCYPLLKSYACTASPFPQQQFHWPLCQYQPFQSTLICVEKGCSHLLKARSGLQTENRNYSIFRTGDFMNN